MVIPTIEENFMSSVMTLLRALGGMGVICVPLKIDCRRAVSEHFVALKYLTNHKLSFRLLVGLLSGGLKYENGNEGKGDHIGYTK